MVKTKVSANPRSPIYFQCKTFMHSYSDLFITFKNNVFNIAYLVKIYIYYITVL